MMRVPGPGATAALVTALAMTGLASRGSAQPIYPTAPPPPVTLDPGAPPAAPTPAPERPAPAQQPQQPPVIVIGPDGKIVPQPSQPQEPTGTYLGEGGEAGAPGEGPGVVQGGQVPELHVVRRGDTLWDICFLYFNDPWQWPKIWSYNPQITNPHWIYPGDLIRLLPRGVFGPAPGEPEVTPTAPGVVPPGPTEPLPAPQRRVEAAIKQTAFVEKAELERATTIDGALDEKVLLGNGDAVYLRYPSGRPPQVGDRYSIYVPGGSVKAGGREVGAYVHVLGTLEVTSVKQDKRAQGVIVEANQEIERGARVGPLLTTFRAVPPTPPKVNAQGAIVAMLTAAQLVGQGTVVFIDLGKRSGVEVGNRMFVVRRGDAYPRQMASQVGQDDRQFPARALGEVLIVDVGENISVGLVTLSVREMSVGDIVVMQASK